MLPDPSAVFRPVPIVPSSVAAGAGARPATPPGVRAIGLAAGLAIATIVAVVGLPYGLFLSVGFDPSFGFVGLVAGSLGGWVMAPAAYRARTRTGWAGVIVVLGLLAVVIGAFTVGEVISIGISLSALASGSVAGVIGGLFVGPFLAFIGVLYVGLFVLPFTLAASAAWGLVMWLARRLAWPR